MNEGKGRRPEMRLGFYSVESREPLKYLSEVQSDLICLVGRPL